MNNFQKSPEDTINGLENIFDEIIEEKYDVQSDSPKCIMRCDRYKSMVLLPCKHQPTCKPCFVLWKMHVSAKNMDVFCPRCRKTVINHIAITDDS